MLVVTVRTTAEGDGYVAWCAQHPDGIRGASPDEAVGALLREIWLGCDESILLRLEYGHETSSDRQLPITQETQ